LLQTQEGALVVSVDLSTREGGGQAVVALRGELAVADAASVAAALAAVAARAPEIIVDLAGLEFIDSSGMAALALARVQARRAGGDLLLAAPHDQVLRVLAVIRLADIFSVHASVHEAAGSAGRRSAGGRSGAIAAAQQDQRACAAMRSGTGPGEATGTREQAEGGRAR
jgi:anti-sigma B factor antagonist